MSTESRRYLKPLYKYVFDEEMDAKQFNCRKELQKEIYLLQEMGVEVGNYSFFWYNHGPYSQDLQNDILRLNTSKTETIAFSKEVKEILDMLKSMFNEETTYSIGNWVECLASVQYLRTNIFYRNEKQGEIIKELEKRKPHLNDRKSNLKALRLTKRTI